MQMLDQTSDLALLKAWQAGDSTGGDGLYRLHYQSIVRFFEFKVGHPHCDDLVQATFVTLHDRPPAYESDAHLRAALFAIARFKLLGFLRDQARAQQRFDPCSDSLVDVVPSMSAQLEAKRRRNLLLAALRRLPIDTQIILELHYWEGLTTAAIAQVIDAPEGTVKTKLTRGRARLEQLISELARNPEELESTRSGLEGWADRIRRECDADELDDEDD